MRKLILAVALLLLPLAASAQQGNTLLTDDGRLLSIRFERPNEDAEVASGVSAYLVLTTTAGLETTREIVPATNSRGAHYEPAIAYDSESGMLFTFWIHKATATSYSNQLMFASRSADGVWSEARSFGDLYDTRSNLRIAVTRKYENEGGNPRSGLSVHLAWWEFDFQSDSYAAKYMMFPIDNGQVVDAESLDLSQFLPEDLELATEPVNQALLKQPLLFPSSKQDSVLVLFGDVATGTLNSVRVTPKKIAGNGRLRVPGGKREGSFKAPTLDVATNRLEAVYGDDDRIALYSADADQVRYVILKDGHWSPQHAISVDEQISSGAAIGALRRLVSEH